jgi:hypothetical protein
MTEFNQGGSCASLAGGFEPGIFRYASADTRHPAAR